MLFHGFNSYVRIIPSVPKKPDNYQYVCQDGDCRMEANAFDDCFMVGGFIFETPKCDCTANDRNDPEGMWFSWSSSLLRRLRIERN